MGVLSAIRDRALSWRPSAADERHINDITDSVKLHFLDKSIGLKPADILTPEEVASRLKVPESWVYEKTRARCRNPMPCLRLGRYIRFNWTAVVSWLTIGADQQPNATRANLSRRR
jgi:excisionase family DNA binding protein